MPARIDVISDVVCPWCYIGKRRLEQALELWRERHPDDTPEVVWHPFELNPDLARTGMDRTRYLEEKFGGPARAQAIYARVEAAGREVGIPFDFGRIQVQPNTVDAHRLVAWASLSDRQSELVEELFRGYFLEARDYTSAEVLADRAAAVGLSRDDALALLASDDGVPEIREAEDTARRIGVQGVPFFIFDQQVALSGAQPAEALVEAMEQARARAAGESAA